MYDKSPYEREEERKRVQNEQRRLIRKNTPSFLRHISYHNGLAARHLRAVESLGGSEAVAKELIRWVERGTVHLSDDEEANLENMILYRRGAMRAGASLTAWFLSAMYSRDQSEKAANAVPYNEKLVDLPTNTNKEQISSDDRIADAHYLNARIGAAASVGAGTKLIMDVFRFLDANNQPLDMHPEDFNSEHRIQIKRLMDELDRFVKVGFDMPRDR